MTVRGPNSMKPLMNSSAESSSAASLQLLSKKNHQNGSLQSSKKSTSQKSNIVESNVSIIFNFKISIIYLNFYNKLY